MTEILVHWALLTLSFWLTTTLLPGMSLRGGFGSHLVIAGAYGVLVFFFAWLLKLMLGVLTIGLAWVFPFVTMILVNAVLLKVLDAFSNRLRIDTFGTAIFAALIMAGVEVIANRLLG